MKYEDQICMTYVIPTFITFIMKKKLRAAEGRMLAYNPPPIRAQANAHR